jgi:hypothetical protein
MGTLFVRNRGSAWGETWEVLGKAQGYIPIPLGKELCLVVCSEASTNLSPLATLNPDDLQWLGLPDSQVSDAGLVHLQGLTGLLGLWLSNTQVGDEGLTHLKKLTALQMLDLKHTQVSDAGLIHLQGLSSLRVLSLSHIQVSDAGVARLQHALPNCLIKR